MKKHQGLILALDSKFAFGLKPETIGTTAIFQCSHDEFEKVTIDHLVLGQRARLEKDPYYKQIIPYVVLYKEIAGQRRYLPYIRVNPGDERLKNNVSIGFGGHIEVQDVVYDGDHGIYLYDTIRNSVVREVITEEVKFVNTIDKNFPNPQVLERIVRHKVTDYFIYDDSNDVGKVHLGIVSFCEIPGNYSIYSLEEGMMPMAFMTAEELLAHEDIELENWSKLILEQDLVNKI